MALDALELIKSGPFFSRYEYALEPHTNTYIAACNVGNAASNFFHQRDRFAAKHRHFRSPDEIWVDQRRRLITLSGLFTLGVRYVDSAALRRVIRLHQYMASQFRPSAAKAIYNYFRCENVLDFSAGWGDRLAAFCASQYTREYYACDPNRALQKNYADQIELYGTSKRIMVSACAAEDCEMPLDHFDLCFTSPPYFNAEHYSNDPDQSWRRYGHDLEAWLHRFLFVALKRSHAALKPNGFLAINLSDVWTGRVSRIVDPMNEFLAKELGLSYCDCWGLRMAQRPNSLADREGVFSEPIWIWRKGDAVELSRYSYARSF